MGNRQQLIIAINIGNNKCAFEQEFESPMGNGMFLPYVKYYEMKNVRNFNGMRVRILKGLSVGGGQSRSHEELTEIDEGYINIYDNFIFAGHSSTISIPLNKIIRIQSYLDGVGIYKEGRQKEYRFIWGKNINMKLINILGNNNRIKQLTGQVIEQYIGISRKNGINITVDKIGVHA